jgi:hypothetical protein
MSCDLKPRKFAASSLLKRAGSVARFNRSLRSGFIQQGNSIHGRNPALAWKSSGVSPAQPLMPGTQMPPIFDASASRPQNERKATRTVSTHPLFARARVTPSTGRILRPRNSRAAAAGSPRDRNRSRPQRRQFRRHGQAMNCPQTRFIHVREQSTTAFSPRPGSFRSFVTTHYRAAPFPRLRRRISPLAAVAAGNATEHHSRREKHSGTNVSPLAE